MTIIMMKGIVGHQTCKFTTTMTCHLNRDAHKMSLNLPKESDNQDLDNRRSTAYDFEHVRKEPSAETVHTVTETRCTAHAH